MNPTTSHERKIRTIRAMRRDDVRAVASIEADRHGADAWSPESFEAALDDPPRYRCLVITEPGSDEPVAYAVLSVAGDTADVDNVTVRADRARRGLGRHLLQRLLAAAETSGASRVLLEVRADNAAAIALYDSAGFVEIHRRRGYYASGHDAVIMERIGDAGE